MPRRVKIYYQLEKTAMIRSIFCFVILLISLKAFSQETVLENRFTPSVDYKLNKKWKFAFDYRLTLKNDFSVFKSSNFQFAITYKIIKSLSLELGYRFTTAFANDNHRLFADLQYEYKIKEWSLSSNTRYQFSTEQFDADFMRDFNAADHYIRQKISASYDVPGTKFSVELAPELFVKINEREVFVQRMRYHASVGYKLKYGNTVGLALFYEDVLKTSKNDRLVINVKYHLSINDLIKKIKKEQKKKKKKKSE